LKTTRLGTCSPKARGNGATSPASFYGRGMSSGWVGSSIQYGCIRAVQGICVPCSQPSDLGESFRHE
jgi:hypothetical protein